MQAEASRGAGLTFHHSCVSVPPITAESGVNLPKRSHKRGGQLVDPVTKMPGHLLRRCHQIDVAVFLDECQGFDLTPPQFVTLSALSTYGALDKATIGGIAALDRTTVAVVLKNLQERGFVVSKPSDQDRRSTLNEITETGLATLRDVLPDVQRVQERVLSPLSDSERAEFVRLLTKISDANNLLSRAPQRTPKS